MKIRWENDRIVKDAHVLKGRKFSVIKICSEIMEKSEMPGQEWEKFKIKRCQMEAVFELFSYSDKKKLQKLCFTASRYFTRAAFSEIFDKFSLSRFWFMFHWTFTPIESHKTYAKRVSSVHWTAHSINWTKNSQIEQTYNDIN